MNKTGISGSWMKINRKQFIVHGLILGCFALYCIFLAGIVTDMIEEISGESRLQAISLPGISGNILCAPVPDVVTRGLVDIKGWAFIKGEDYKDCQTFIVLKSANNTYVFDTLWQYRPDVAIYFENLGLDLGWSGFWAKIPIRKIKDGEYLIGVYIKKGDKEALQYVDQCIIKSGNTIVSSKPISRQQTFTLPPDKRDIALSIDKSEKATYSSKIYTEISGWAFINGYDNKNSKICLVLKSDNSTYVFDTILMGRPDVTANFVDTGLDLNNSGFKARIAEGSVPAGDYQIGIFITTSGKQALQYTEKTLKVE